MTFHYLKVTHAQKLTQSYLKDQSIGDRELEIAFPFVGHGVIFLSHLPCFGHVVSLGKLPAAILWDSGPVLATSSPHQTETSCSLSWSEELSLAWDCVVSWTQCQKRGDCPMWMSLGVLDPGLPSACLSGQPGSCGRLQVEPGKCGAAQICGSGGIKFSFLNYFHCYETKRSRLQDSQPRGCEH